MTDTTITVLFPCLSCGNRAARVRPRGDDSTLEIYTGQYTIGAPSDEVLECQQCSSVVDSLDYQRKRRRLVREGVLPQAA